MVIVSLSGPKHELFKRFRDVAATEHFADVTLLGDGQVKGKAHKAILCAASPVLAEILKNIPDQELKISLVGVGQQQMESLLDFMYTGEAKIDKILLPHFVKIATDLEIKELDICQEDESRLDSIVNVNTVSHNISESSNNPTSNDQLICDETIGLSEEGPFISNCFSMTDSWITDSSSYLSSEDFSCDKCDFTSYNQESLKNHKHSVHKELFVCEKCEQFFLRKVSLDKHKKLHIKSDLFCDICNDQISTMKEGATFVCTHCQYVAKTLLSFNSHIRNRHHQKK